MGKFRFCIEDDECYNAFREVQKVEQEKKNTKDWNKEKKEIKQSLKTKQDYEKELERIFNKFIRLRDAQLPCVSCDAPPGTYKLTAGHFYPAGSYKNIRFDEDNVHGQCWFNCNKNRHGNLLEYRPRLIKRIGSDNFEQLERRAKETRHYSIPELIELKVIYKEKIKNLSKTN
jgi:uncharacterized protein involved in tolerance to divalent cations